MALKQAQPETQLDVDTFILDFLLYEATRAVLDDARSDDNYDDERRDPELTLKLVHSFVPIFKCNHPHADVPDETRFRHRLLHFATLYTRRHTDHPYSVSPEVLEALRYTHRQRAESWWQESSYEIHPPASWSKELPPSPGSRDSAQRRTQAQLGLDPRIPPPTPGTTPTLLDLLPLFIALSAALRQLPDAQNTDINETWMRLAAEFMIQAVLEQWLILGARGPDKFMEAFAWGFRDVIASSEWPDEDIVNDMFCEEGLLQEVEAWSEIRQRAMAALQPPAGTPLIPHLESVAARLPIADFEDKIVEIVTALHCSQDEPLLRQVELGEVSGLSTAETAALKAHVRWPVVS